jgi:lysophospholipase L1-like esterase
MKRKLILLAALSLALNVSGEVLIKDGQKVAFLGDSITAGGWDKGGYVRLIVSALEREGVKITPVPAGVGGHKSNDMLARLDKDVLDKNPDWMTLSCGVNDVWHGDRGVDLENYEKNITAIADRAAAKNVKVIILTATVIGEEDNKNNEKLSAYNDFLRRFARERNLPLADLNADFQQILRPLNPGKNSRYLTVDGVHMNPDGNVTMAKGVLRAMGFTAAQLADIEQRWLAEPDTARVTVYPFDPRPDGYLTLGQYRGLAKIAQERGVSAVDFGRSLWLRSLSAVVQAHAGDPILNAEEIKKEANKRLLADLDELLEWQK